MIPEDPGAHLRAFLASLPARRAAGAEALAELDSLSLMQVVLYLEQTYGIRLADRQVDPDALRSLEGILGIIRRYARDIEAEEQGKPRVSEPRP